MSKMIKALHFKGLILLMGLVLIDLNILVLSPQENVILWKVSVKNTTLSISISSDGSYVVAGGGSGLFFFNKVGDMLYKYKLAQGHSFFSVSISSDGSYVAAGSTDHHVYFFDRNGTLLWKYKVEGNINSVSISSDGSYVAAGGGSYWKGKCQGCRVYFFSKDGLLLWEYETVYDVNAVSISSDGSYVAAGSTDHHVYFFDRNGTLLWKYKTDNMVFSVSISSDGSYVAAGDLDHYTYFFDRNGTLLWKYMTGGDVFSVSISSDGSYLAAGAYHYVYFFYRNGTLLWKHEAGKFVRTVSISSDGSYLAAGATDGSICMMRYLRSQPPIAMLKTSKTKAKPNELIEFDASSSYDLEGEVSYYYFDFGDGHDTDWVTYPKVNHSYDKPGLYHARVKVKDDSGMISEWSNFVDIKVSGTFPKYVVLILAFIILIGFIAMRSFRGSADVPINEQTSSLGHIT